MIHRSFIFNFKEWGLSSSRAHRVMTVVVALLILCVFEYAVARREQVWAYVPKTQTGVLFEMERRLTRAPRAPDVVILGNSRLRDGISPRVIAETLDIDTHRVVNLSITMGTAYDSLLIYDRNREHLGTAKLLIVGIDDWYVNAAIPPNDRDRQFRSPDIAWIGLTARHGIDVAVGAFWRTFAARNILRQHVHHLGRTPEPLPFTEDGRIIWRDEAETIGVQDVDVRPAIRHLYEPYVFDAGSLRFIEQVTGLAHEDGLEVLLFQLPFRSSYVREVRVQYPQAYDAYVAARSRLAARVNATSWFLDEGDELGVFDQDFIDYGHPSGAAANKISAALAERIRPILRGR